MVFFEELEQRAREINSVLCIGLDPHIPDLAEPSAVAARKFCLSLIEATAQVAAAFKPNAAFFEAFGAEGWRALAEVIAAVPEGIPVILDAKRGDIASTAQAYARSAFETLGAGAITLNPYLGGDAIAPFLAGGEHGVFLLCKTSNPGAEDFQDLLVEGWHLYEAVAEAAQRWARSGELGSGQIGLVAGATHPQALERVRGVAPDLWILAPGVGAQGGELEATLQAGLRADGLGLLLPVSRGVARADDPRRAADELREQINRIREKISTNRPGRSGAKPHSTKTGQGSLSSADVLADGLLEAGCVKFGEFTLKSGLKSPIYIDLRRLVGFPRLLEQAAAAYVALLGGLQFDRLAALPYAALPIGAAVSLIGSWPLVYPRKEVKEYGTRAEVEGVYTPGEKVVIIDDLATTGGSKFEAIQRLEAAGLKATDVVVLIDRQSGAAQALAERGYRLHSLFTLSGLLDRWEQAGKVDADQIAAARRFIHKTSPQ